MQRKDDGTERVGACLSVLTPETVILALARYEAAHENGSVYSAITRDLGLEVPDLLVCRKVNECLDTLREYRHVERTGNIYHLTSDGKMLVSTLLKNMPQAQAIGGA